MRLVLALFLLVSACGDDEVTRDSGVALPDGPILGISPDAPIVGASPDARPTADAGVDAGIDAGSQPDAPPAPVSVLTQHNDLQRTGANLLETTLDTRNVTPTRFGKLFTRDVDGSLYAQPLVVSGLAVGGVRRNVVYLATMHNSVYAYDADEPAASAPLWHVNLGAPVDASEYTCNDIIVEDGITSTPVIDLPTKTLYVSAKHKEAGVYAQTLHALDLATGAEKFGGPIDIEGSVPGSGWGSKDGLTVPFNAKVELQRPALLLSRGQIYLAFGSHCDHGGYHGWLMAYDAATLAQTHIWNVTPDGGEGSIWMSGQGPSVDSDGNLYVVTANGDDDVVNGTQLSEAFVKLSPTLSVMDWFVPHNYEALNVADLDLGSDGALLVPNSHLVISSGKEGVLYLVDRTRMGHFHEGDDSQIVQSFKIAADNVHGTPIYWQGPTEAFIYVWPEQTKMMAFRMQGAGVDPTASSQSTMRAPMGMPGGILSISANGSRAGSAIVWAAIPYMGNANKGTVPGIVRAFDAADVSHELWNSETNSTRDSVGDFAKFAAPTVVNGKVYVGTFSGKLAVYGLLP